MSDNRNGWNETVERLYRRYYGYVKTILINRGCPYRDADDFVQQIFCKLLEREPLTLGSEKDETKFLCSITHHKVIDYWRKTNSRGRRLEVVFKGFCHANVCERTPLENLVDFETSEANWKMAEEILEGVRYLSPRRRKVMQLYLKGMDKKQIATELGISVHNMETTLGHGRESLIRRYFDERGS